MAATKVSEFRLENNYNDSVGSNTMSAQGSGNSFSTSVKKRGSYSLTLNGSGWALKAGQSGFGSGNIDLSWGGFFYVPDTTHVQSFGGFGVSTSNNDANMWATLLSATSIRVDLGSDLQNFTVPSLANNTWYHLWIEYTAATKTANLYINNVVSSSGPLTFASNLNLNATTDIQIGADPDGNAIVTGNLDQWEFWSGVTTTGQRTAIFNPVTFVPKVVLF